MHESNFSPTKDNTSIPPQNHQHVKIWGVAKDVTLKKEAINIRSILQPMVQGTS